MDNFNLNLNKTPELREDSEKIPSSSTSADCGEGFTFPNVETSQAFYWPLSPNRSERILHTEAGNKMTPQNKSWAGEPKNKLYSSTSGESGVESSSIKAEGFPLPFPPPPKTGKGSFGAQASCWYENPRKRAHDSAVAGGLEPEQAIELLKGARATLSDEKLQKDYEALKKLKLSENASDSGRRTQADQSTQSHSDNEVPSGKSQNEFMEIKHIASEFLLKILGTQLVRNIFADAGISPDTNQMGIASNTNQAGISSDTVVAILALAIITTITLKKAES